MRCIFCKNNSDNSKSVEHIIPESLGNKNHVLPVGIVCDTCNNYFARKVEGPVLNSPFFRTLRSEQFLMSKKGRPAQVSSILGPNLTKINLAFPEPENDENKTLSVIIPNPHEWDNMLKQFESEKNGTFYVPICSELPSYGHMDRFLSKVAVEAMALRLMSDDELLNDMIEHEQIDIIRNYARYGKGVKSWPYSQRIIYPKNKIYISKSGKTYQKIFEFDLLLTPKKECYFILCLFGIEFSINMAGPNIEGYKQWLKNNNGKSPLYC